MKINFFIYFFYLNFFCIKNVNKIYRKKYFKNIAQKKNFITKIKLVVAFIFIVVFIFILNKYSIFPFHSVSGSAASSSNNEASFSTDNSPPSGGTDNTTPSTPIAGSAVKPNTSNNETSFSTGNTPVSNSNIVISISEKEYSDENITPNNELCSTGSNNPYSGLTPSSGVSIPQDQIVSDPSDLQKLFKHMQHIENIEFDRRAETILRKMQKAIEESNENNS